MMGWQVHNAGVKPYACLGVIHRLNMDLDRQSLFGLLCTAVLYSLAETPQLPHSPRIRIANPDPDTNPLA